jgi:hypothetical protein
MRARERAGWLGSNKSAPSFSNISKVVSRGSAHQAVVAKAFSAKLKKWPVPSMMRWEWGVPAGIFTPTGLSTTVLSGHTSGWKI